MAVFIFGRSQAPSLFAENFADNTWEEIITACQSNKVPYTWLVGDYKTMTIDGVDYQIDIIGKNHDTYSDGTGTAPLTLQLHECYNAGTYRMNLDGTNVGGWRDCYARSTLLPNLFARMPDAVKAGIRQVNKMTSEGGTSSTIVTTADTLFLLAEIEIFGVRAFSADGEGTQYAYYKEGNNTLKNQNGSPAQWYTRSPVVSNQKFFVSVDFQGAVGSYNATTTLGISFAFCF